MVVGFQFNGHDGRWQDAFTDQIVEVVNDNNIPAKFV